MAGVSPGQFAGFPPREPFLPFAHGGFRTRFGKAELYSEALKAQGLDPVADFTPPDGIAARVAGEDVSAGAAGPQGGQLPEYHVF